MKLINNQQNRKKTKNEPQTIQTKKRYKKNINNLKTYKITTTQNTN